jgi:uncharacterized protein
MSSSSYRDTTLLDTGPLVAWFDRSDQDPAICAAFFHKHNGALAEVAPRFLSWVSLGGLNVAELSGSDLELMAGWMRQYGDLPMDLADASLLWVAQEQGLRRIATLDRSDFGIVRLPGGESLENLLDA